MAEIDLSVEGKGRGGGVSSNKAVRLVSSSSMRRTRLPGPSSWVPKYYLALVVKALNGPFARGRRSMGHGWT